MSTKSTPSLRLRTGEADALRAKHRRSDGQGWPHCLGCNESRPEDKDGCTILRLLTVEADLRAELGRLKSAKS